MCQYLASVGDPDTGLWVTQSDHPNGQAGEVSSLKRRAPRGVPRG